MGRMNKMSGITLSAGVVMGLALLVCPAFPTRAQQAAQGADPVEAAIKPLGRLVGGTWKTTGNFRREFRYEWRIPGKAIRGMGRAAIGTPQEFVMESLYGWDAAEKKVYYMDFHGADTVYKGWVEGTGSKFSGDFEGHIGDKGHYRFTDELTDDDTMESSMFAKNKVGEWVKIHSMSWKRTRN